MSVAVFDLKKLDTNLSTVKWRKKSTAFNISKHVMLNESNKVRKFWCSNYNLYQWLPVREW